MKTVGYGLITAGIGILVYMGVSEQDIVAFVGAAIVAIGGAITLIRDIIASRKEG